MRVPADFPRGVDLIELWTHAGVECAVGSVGSALYGLARVGAWKTGWTSQRVLSSAAAGQEQVFTPENLGDWVAFAEHSLSAYASPEVLSRMVTTGSSDLAAWDVCGHDWAIEKIQADVNEFVDTVVQPVPQQGARDRPD